MLTQHSLRFAARARHACLALAATLLLVPLAQADSAAQPSTSSAGDAPRVTVSYRDLDLARPTDARTLLRRIEWAAHQVCGDLEGPRPLAQLAPLRQCYARAVARAVGALHAQALTTQYLAAFGNAARTALPRG